jgi:peptide deformylase
MDRNNIITLPSPNLRRRSKKVGFLSDDIRQLISDMESATLDWEDSRPHEVGVALAAVQVDSLLRVVVVRNNFDDKSDRSFYVLINPEITKYDGKQVADYEGCLSIKEVYGLIKRYEKVRVKALDINGKPIRITAKGFLARILQHEIDHTNGIVFIDHIKDDKNAFYKLDTSGDLKPLEYESEILDNPDLWG